MEGGGFWATLSEMNNLYDPRWKLCLVRNYTPSVLCSVDIKTNRICERTTQTKLSKDSTLLETRKQEKGLQMTSYKPSVQADFPFVCAPTTSWCNV